MSPEEARRLAESDARQGSGWTPLPNVHHETRNAYEAERTRIAQQEQQKRDQNR